tara:strand:+ start:696 stop:1520 length:825 start_codon:yes stop_codon:yes gene_type:complete
MAKITSKEETWTPTQARTILAKGGPNRKLNERLVSDYAAAMKDRKWIMNGETIKISRAGKLLDGQHRLNAVIESGKTVTMLTVRGLLPTTQATIDDGMKRHLHHILQINGEKHATTLAFSLSLLKRWETQQLHTIRSRGEHRRPRRDQCVHMLKKHPGIRDFVAHKFTFQFRNTLASGGLFAFAWYVCDQSHPDTAALFFEQLATGVAMSDTDPVYHLRERFLRSKLSVDPRLSLDALSKLTLLARAWNATVDGKVIKHLKLPNTKGPFVLEFK